MTWEYHVSTRIVERGEGILDALNRRTADLRQLGDDGWELVSTIPIDENGTIGTVDTFRRVRVSPDPLAQ